MYKRQDSDRRVGGRDIQNTDKGGAGKQWIKTVSYTHLSGAELSGATLTVLDKDGNVVDTWTSDAKEAHVIKKLVVGKKLGIEATAKNLNDLKLARKREEKEAAEELAAAKGHLTQAGCEPFQP